MLKRGWAPLGGTAVVCTPLDSEPSRHGSAGTYAADWGVWLCGSRLSFPTTVFSRVVQALPPGGYSTTDTTGSSELPYAVLRLSNDAGGASTDILFANVPLPDGTPYSIRNGSTLVR
jgi:hypothetical protein